MNISVYLSSSLLAALLLFATGCARSGDPNPSSDVPSDETSQHRADSTAPIGQPLKEDNDMIDPFATQESTNNSSPQTPSSPSAMPSEAPLPSSTASGSSGPVSNPSDQPAPRNDGAPSSAPLRPEDLPSAGGGAPGPSHTLDEQVALVRAVLASHRGLENVVPTGGSDGCITLTGTVATATRKNEAVALTRGTAGVRCVVDKMDVAK